MAEKIATGEGILAHVDALGRVTIPKPMRARMGLQEHSQVLITGNADSITIHTYIPQDDLTASINVLAAQVEEMCYNPDVSSEVVGQLTDMIDDMREMLKTAGLRGMLNRLEAAQAGTTAQETGK